MKKIYLRQNKNTLSSRKYKRRPRVSDFVRAAYRYMFGSYQYPLQYDVSKEGKLSINFGLGWKCFGKIYEEEDAKRKDKKDKSNQTAG